VQLCCKRAVDPSISIASKRCCIAFELICISAGDHSGSASCTTFNIQLIKNWIPFQSPDFIRWPNQGSPLACRCNSMVRFEDSVAIKLHILRTPCAARTAARCAVPMGLHGVPTAKSTRVVSDRIQRLLSIRKRIRRWSTLRNSISRPMQSRLAKTSYFLNWEVLLSAFHREAGLYRHPALGAFFGRNFR
jgi:hypothetical protein